LLKFVGVLFERTGHKGTRIERAFCVPWTETDILEVFGSDPATSKHAQQLFGAAIYKEGTKRGNAGLNSVCAAVLDCDHADVGELDRISSSIRAAGYAHIAYTSWSHGKVDKVHKGTGKSGPFDSFRIVLPYSREVSPAEHAAIVPALFGHEVPADPAHYAKEVLGKWIEDANGRPRAASPRGWDPTCSTPSRGYFIPSAHSTIDVYQGNPLYVDDILQRDTTARPSQAKFRPYQAPDEQAVGALARIVDLLSKKTGVEAQGYEGWQRAACPACAPSGHQRSPSFTVRANGNGVDLRCHAGCSRKELLGALGLTSTGAFAPPTALRLLVEEQLAVQAPAAEAVSVDAAVAKLVVDIREGLAAREPTIIQYPAGTGKSFASAKVLAEYARQGYRLVYSTQEHVVANETRNLLPPDVRARSVHVHSPLIQVGEDPICKRADELKERVFEFGVSLLGSICPRCPQRPDCPAFAAATQRAKAMAEASVIFVSHAGIRQLFGEDKGDDLQLIVDEMPGTYECVSLSREHLKLLAKGARLTSAEVGCAHLAATIARAWCVGVEPGKVQWGPNQEPVGNAVELAVEWGRLRLRDDAEPRAAERPLLKAADALIRLCAHKAQGGTVGGIGLWEQGDIAAMLPDACHQALVRRAGVLLSATPLMAALPGFKLRECAVTDGAKVTRKMVVRGQRGSKALTESYYDDEAGLRQRRGREPGEAPGIPWPAIDEALARAAREASRYDCKRVLFVSFKTVIDAIRERGVPENVELGHYGALRGKNNWQERAPKECSVIYLLGTPRFAVMPTLYQLGLTGEAADQAWVAYAAGELTQAEGRLRLPRRTKPCTVFVEGDVAPASWHAESIDEWIEDDLIETPSGLLEGALLWYPQAELAEVLGPHYARALQPLTKDLPALRRLSLPSVPDGVGLLSEMQPKRRATHEQLFSWASGLDEQ
jgi:hypothetical protein